MLVALRLGDFLEWFGDDGESRICRAPVAAADSCGPRTSILGLWSQLLSSRHPAHARHARIGERPGDDPSSFATYMRHRPEPQDGVEPALLRLDWLRWRLAHRRSA